MTNHEIEIVRKSWKSLQGINPVLLGDVFYSRLFIENPSIEKMFKTSKAEQSKKLIDMLDSIIRNLNHLEVISDDIKQMAVNHVGYGVKPKHYEWVGDSLIWTLKTAMAKEWNPELEKAWLNCYAALTKAMLSNS